MKCLVTGGAGFIGSALVEVLLQNNETVHVWDDLSSGWISNLKENVVFKHIKIEDIKSNEDFDIIFHLAAKSSIPKSLKYPLDTLQSNVVGTMNVLEIARDCGAKIVYAGSASAYDDPRSNPYALTKYMGEELCRMYHKLWNVPIAIMRFFNVYGERQNSNCDFPGVVASFEKQVLKKEPIYIMGTGDKTRDFISVKDVARGIYEAGRTSWIYNCEIMNLGSGKSTSINELAEMFKYDKIVHLDDRPGEIEDSKADISLSLQMMKWKPIESLNDYVENFLKRQNKN